MKFPKDVLRSCLWEDGAEFEGGELELVTSMDHGTSRWSSHHTMLFTYKGVLRGADYSKGLSETQDESPFEYADAEIDCPEYETVQVTTTTYRQKT